MTTCKERLADKLADELAREIDIYSHPTTQYLPVFLDAYSCPCVTVETDNGVAGKEDMNT